LEGMKAIPLIACLALVAVQSRAQNIPPADAAAPTPAAVPPTLADRAKLLAEIKTFRREQKTLPPGTDQKLNDLEREAGDADDLGRTRKKFQDLKDSLQTGRRPVAARSILDDSSRGAAKMETIGDNAARVAAAAHEGGHYYDGSSHSSLEPAAAPGEAVTAEAGAKDASAVVNAPASTPELHISAVPSPDEPPPPPVLTPDDLPPWVERNGISPIDYEHFIPPPPPPEAPSLPPSNKPAALAAIETWIDRTGISDEVIANLKKIEVLGSDLLTGFGGYCYWGVKWMLTMVLPGYNQPKDLDLPAGDAYRMLLALKDPKLLAKLHLFPLDLKSLPRDQADSLPERTLLIWDRGCAGFSDQSGHIEFTLHADKMKQLEAKAFYPLSRKYGFWVPNLDPKTQVLACSDGCEVHTMAKLRLYAGKCLSAYVPVAEHHAGS
jgi:hypothetical protein